MKTYLQLENTHPEALPPEFGADDIRFAAGLVRHFLQAYTQPGQRVFDPFAGFGTTLIAAEALGRLGYGLELSEAKVAYARARLRQPENLLHGDARRLLEYALPLFDFALTSPPYMSKGDLSDPFSDYASRGQGYAAYLHDLRRVFGQLRARLQPAATVVVEVANLKVDGALTTLAWDVAGEVARVLHFEGEVVVCWDRYGYGYDHSYCLIYSAL